jgi:SAM-dependent methyltransferase
MSPTLQQAFRALPGYPWLGLTVMPFKFVEFVELTRMQPVSRSDRVLDLGSGFGFQSLLMARRCGQVVGVEPEEAYVATSEAKLSVRRVPNVEFWCTTLEQAGVATNSFDKVFSFSVVEHILNYREVISEVLRVLKPGGHFVFSTDCLAGIPEDLREKHRRDHHVQVYFSIDALKRILQSAGFRSVEVRPLFTTEYARNAFIEGIRNEFNFGVLHAWNVLLHLKREQSRPGPYAMFLVVRAQKPV